MATIDPHELIPALEEEQRARLNLEAVEFEIQKIHRANGKPSPEQIAALRQAAIKLVAAGQAVLKII